MSSKKLPAMQFYPGDWLKDTRLLSPAAKGAWIDLMVAMWDSKERGKITATITQFSRLIGTSDGHGEAILQELFDHDICDHHNEGEKITIVCRRMVRDEEERQKKAYAGRKGGKKSRPPSKEESEDKQDYKQNGSTSTSKIEAKEGSSSSSSSSSSNKELYTGEFEKFWELYDVKKGKKKAAQEWKKLTKKDKELIFDNVPIFLTHFSSKQYTPRPRKYLYNEFWKDEDYQQPPKNNTNNGTELQLDKAQRHAEQTARIWDD